MEGLAKRQRVLVERLQTLCDRAFTWTFPTRIEEVWGFGSFFRLKGDPKDLDLGLKCSGDNSAWLRYRELVMKSVSTASERRDSYPSPGDALREEVMKSPDGEKVWPVYSKWVEGLTWGAIEREFVPGMAYGWETITRQMLTKGLPRIQVASFAGVGQKFPLVTEALTLVWSRSKPDVRSNLLASFGEGSLKDRLVVELVGFDSQLSSVGFELSVRTRLYKSLIPVRPEEFPPESDYRARHDWLVSKAQKLFPVKDQDRVKKLFESRSLFDEEAPAQKRGHEGDSYRTKDVKDLQEVSERKRAELKDGHREVEVVKALLDGVIAWKGGRLDKNDYFSRYTVEEWLAQSALRNSHKKLVSEDQIRDLLRRHGLPEDRILKRQGSTSDYLLPESGEEAAKIRLSNAKLDAQHELARLAKKEAKKIDDRLYVGVDVGDDLKPIRASISYHLSEGERGPGTNKRLEWCRRIGFKVDEQSWGTHANLQIPLDPRDSAKGVARRLQEALSKGK